MDVVILILCLALTFVILGILLCGFHRVKSDFLRLEAETQELDSCAREIVVKQTAGDVRFSYIPQPKAVSATEISQIANEPAEENGIFIRASEKLTFREKYDRLPRKTKSLLDSFTDYIIEKPNCDKIIQANALIFRYKKGMVAKAMIRRDNVILQLNILHPEFGRLVREEKLKSIKLNLAEVRLMDETELEMAKQTADITLNYLQKEEEYKLEKRKAARREAARSKRKEGVSQ